MRAETCAFRHEARAKDRPLRDIGGVRYAVTVASIARLDIGRLSPEAVVLEYLKADPMITGRLTLADMGPMRKARFSDALA
jgi:hypothetical protein